MGSAAVPKLVQLPPAQTGTYVFATAAPPFGLIHTLPVDPGRVHTCMARKNVPAATNVPEVVFTVTVEVVP